MTVICERLSMVFFLWLKDGEEGWRKYHEKTYGEEEIANIMRDVDRQAHIREMEAVAQPNQRKRHNMMADKLFEILPRLLQQQAEHEGLLRPIASLQQIIRFEQTLVRTMREPFKHAHRVEIPHRRPRHDI